MILVPMLLLASRAMSRPGLALHMLQDVTPMVPNARLASRLVARVPSATAVLLAAMARVLVSVMVMAFRSVVAVTVVITVATPPSSTESLPPLRNCLARRLNGLCVAIHGICETSPSRLAMTRLAGVHVHVATGTNDWNGWGGTVLAHDTWTNVRFTFCARGLNVTFFF